MKVPFDIFRLAQRRLDFFLNYEDCLCHLREISIVDPSLDSAALGTLFFLAFITGSQCTFYFTLEGKQVDLPLFDVAVIMCV